MCYFKVTLTGHSHPKLKCPLLARSFLATKIVPANQCTVSLLLFYFSSWHPSLPDTSTPECFLAAYPHWNVSLAREGIYVLFTVGLLANDRYPINIC